jgi:NitT/TauT family transport system permease protein
MPAFSVLQIALDIVYSWSRMLIALILSIGFSLAVGILAARDKKAESIIIPLLDIFQSVPILGFFPIVILGIVALIPSVIGVNIGIIFLIFTSMSWNITFAVYESVKSIPQDYIDLSSIAGSTAWQRITSIYIPASLGRIAYNSQISWSVGLFYLVSSEILTLGSRNLTQQYHIQGISIAMFGFINSGNTLGYAYAFVAFILAVIVWQFVFLREFALWAEKYKFVEEPRPVRRDPLLRFYSWVNHRSISKLFLLRQGSEVNRLTSSISRFQRGIKYAVLITLALFVAFEIGAYLISGQGSSVRPPSFSTIGIDEVNVLVGLAFSFLRVWYVYFLVVLVSVPAGIIIALNSKLYDTVSPVLQIVASIPAPMILPLLAIYVTKNGEAIAAIVIFLGMIWYIIFNVIAGIRSVPTELWELRREFRVSRFQAWRNVYLPAIAGAFVTGSITAVGAAWNTLIVAEYFQPYTQVSYGIGKVIDLADAQTPNADLITLTLAVLSMTALIIAFNLTVWRRVYHYVTKRYAYNR